MTMPFGGLTMRAVRRVVVHECIECLLRVEHDQVAHTLRSLHVDHPLLEMAHDSRTMLRGGDDDGGLAVEKSLTDERGNGLEERGLVRIELHRMVLIVDRGGHAPKDIVT